ncbi:MAG: hypothetical protein HYZ42_18490 [Bacteroidetes bacterium]|nr:hypothetical protein [Bacteroidota bacterium]
MKGKFQLSLMHSPYFSGIANYDYGSVAKKIDENNAIGLSVIRFAIDNIPNTLDLKDASGQININRIKTFSVSDYGIYLTYARQMTDNSSLGGSAKIIRRTIGSFANAWGFGIDFGYQKKINDWELGLVGRDITFTFTGWKMTLSEADKNNLIKAGNEIPVSSLEVTAPRIIGGVSRKFDLNDNFSLRGSLDLHVTLDGKRNTLIKTNAFSMAPQLGFECGYKKLAFLRLGATNFQHQQTINQKSILTLQPTIGVGVKLKALVVDYAFTDLGNVSAAQYSHIFSLKFTIGEEEE